MPESVRSRDKHTSKSELGESQKTSHPPSLEEVEESPKQDEEKGIEITKHAEKPFDAHSTKSTESVIPPPPDGGLHAWLKVFGGFMIYVRLQAPHLDFFTEITTDQHMVRLVHSSSVNHLTFPGALRYPMAPFKRTTNPTCYPPPHHLQYRGSELCKPGY